MGSLTIMDSISDCSCYSIHSFNSSGDCKMICVQCGKKVAEKGTTFFGDLCKCALYSKTVEVFS